MLAGALARDSNIEGAIARRQSAQLRRTLSDEQRQTLLQALSRFPGQGIAVFSIMADDDGQEYARQFIALFAEAKWSLPREGLQRVVLDRQAPSGIRVAVSKTLRGTGKVRAAATDLANTLVALNLMPNQPFRDIDTADIPDGLIIFMVGVKSASALISVENLINRWRDRLVHQTVRRRRRPHGADVRSAMD